MKRKQPARTNDYEIMAEFPSSSTPGKMYTVKRHKTTGELSCNCRPWVFKVSGSVRNCKHCDQVRAQEKMQAVRADATPYVPDRETRVIRVNKGRADDEFRLVMRLRQWTVMQNVKTLEYVCDCDVFGKSRKCVHVQAARDSASEKERAAQSIQSNNGTDKSKSNLTVAIAKREAARSDAEPVGRRGRNVGIVIVKDVASSDGK